MTDAQRVDAALDYYVDHHTEQSSLMLLKALAFPSQGGFGYRIELVDALRGLDHYEVDEAGKLIKLDRRGLLASYQAKELASTLEAAIEVGVFGSRRSLAYRLGIGAGKVVLGAVETAVGMIGILIPEPGTSVGGIALTMLGAHAAADARELIGPMGFHLGSLAIGPAGAIRILQVPGNATLRMGAGPQPEAAALGPDLWHGMQLQSVLQSEVGALTILEVDNSSRQSIMRFVIQLGRLYVNGRIVGTKKIRVHETNWRVVTKGILEALWQPVKRGS